MATQVSGPSDAPSQVPRIYRLYEALFSTMPFQMDLGLGGKFVYAGEIDTSGRELLFAANIAGAASLAASADPAIQRQAMRDGVVDFVVTSLEEALRILKNEIRKHQAVSVGIAADPVQVTEEMVGRGVLPDLLAPTGWGRPASEDAFLADGAIRLKEPYGGHETYITWAVNVQAARWLPRLNLVAQSVLPPDDAVRHRWLRLGPRYLGRMAQQHHGVALRGTELQQFRDRAKELIVQESTPDGPLVLATIQPAGNS